MALYAAEAPAFYRLAQVLLRLGFSLLQGIRVDGLEHIPPAGGCLIVANHCSWLDPPVLGCCVGHRQLHFMAKRELFERPRLGAVIRRLGAFPVERGQADRKSMRIALELLAGGRTVCVFPEGTRGEGGAMQPWHIGMAMLAHHAQVPLIPAALTGTRCLLEDRHQGRPRQPIRIRFGPAVPIADLEGPGKARLGEILNRAFVRVDSLLKALHRPAGL